MVEYKNLRENSTIILEREIKPYEVYRNMKGCILETNFEGQGWSSRLFTILLILTWELRYPQERGVNRKRGGSFGSSSAWEGRKMTHLGEGRICLGDEG